MKLHSRLFQAAGASVLAAGLLLAVGGTASAQLGGGPSPMFHHDERHTGQSHLLGPLFPSGAPDASNVQSWLGTDWIRTSPALSADGSTLYVGLGFDFYAVDTATMATNWRYRLRADVSDSSPAVAADGTIYVGDRDNTLSAFNPDGTLKFLINHGFEGDVWTSPVIGPATLPAAHQRGTIYYAHDQTKEGVGIFRAVNPNGTEKWTYKIGTFVRQSSPAIDKNGIIYLGDLGGYLHAFRDNGQGNVERIWKYRVSNSSPGLTASPVISADSTTLYIGTNSSITGFPLGVTALDITNPACFSSTPPTCNPVRWTFATAGKVDQTPALATDGTLYVPAMDGGQKRLYAVNPNGTQKWVFGPIASGADVSAYPVIGADGVVYVGIKNGIYALSPATGSQLWAYQTTNFVHAFPVIAGNAAPGGTGTAIIYVPSRDRRIYKISATRSAGGQNHAPIANAGPDQAAVVGQVVTFDGSGSSDPDFDPIVSYSWTFGDGSVGTGVSPTHTYLSPSPASGYTATLIVSDGFTNSAADSMKVTVTSGGGGNPNQFQDDFNRADSDTLGGPSQTGPQWSETAGDLSIASQRLVNNLRGDNIGVLSTLTGADMSASGDFTSSDNNASPRLGVLLRYQDARNHYRLYRITGGSSQLRISKLVNGNETLLKSVNVPQAVVNLPFHLVGSINGTTLTLTMGTTQITATDSTYANGTVGVLVNTGPAGTHTADNFCASIGTTLCP